MKITTTLLEIMTSYLNNGGESEFFGKVNGKTQIIMDNSDDSYIRRISRYNDDEIKHIVTNQIFNNFSFNDVNTDEFFKRTFMSRFLTKQIGMQTIETFSLKLQSYCLRHEVEIENLAVNLLKYYQGVSSSKNNGGKKYGSDNGYSDLPQDQLTYNLEDKNLENPTDARKIRGYDDNNSNTDNQNFNPDAIAKLHSVWDNIFMELNKILFLHVI